MTGTTYSLGRVVNHDPRSLAYQAKTAPLKTVTHRGPGSLFYGQVLDQGELGACTGFAIAHALNSVPLRRGRKLLTATDAINLYSRATHIDPFPGAWPPVDTGSSSLAICKAAQEAGLITSYRHAFGVDQALAALVLQPIIIGVPWYSEMFWPDTAGYLNIDGDNVGGHEVSLVAINTRLERVTVLNNWSARWGINGRAYLRFTDLDTLLRQRGDATVPVR